MVSGQKAFEDIECEQDDARRLRRPQWCLFSRFLLPALIENVRDSRHLDGEIFIAGTAFPQTRQNGMLPSNERFFVAANFSSATDRTAKWCFAYLVTVDFSHRPGDVDMRFLRNTVQTLYSIFEWPTQKWNFRTISCSWKHHSNGYATVGLTITCFSFFLFLCRTLYINT